MDPRKFTEKSLLAFEASQNEATRRQNTQIISIHLLQALVAQENGLIPRLLERMESVLPTFQMQLAQRLESLPTLSGSSKEQVMARRTKSGPRHGGRRIQEEEGFHH